MAETNAAGQISCGNLVEPPAVSGRNAIRLSASDRRSQGAKPGNNQQYKSCKQCFRNDTAS